MNSEQDREKRPCDAIEAPSLSRFLRVHRDEILAAWEERVRRLPRREGAARPLLVDHVPALLDRIADIASDLAAGGPPALPLETAARHALARIEEGFDLGEVAMELSILRDSAVAGWSAAGGDTESARVLDRAIDAAAIALVDRYTAERDRLADAVDDISAAALETREPAVFLDRLANLVCESIPGVDTAAILIRREDELELAAAVGLDEDLAAGLHLPIGTGFAGTIASTWKPRELAEAWRDPDLAGDSLRRRKVRALFGVPLIDAAELIGVAHVGSRGRTAFSERERALLRAIADRAAAALAHHLWRIDAAARERQQTALTELGLHALRTPDAQSVSARAARVVADTLGVEYAKTLELLPSGDALLFRAGVGWREGLVGRAKVPIGPNSQAGYALVHGEPVVTRDLRADPRFSGTWFLREHGVVSGISAVIRAPGPDGRAYGIFGAHTGRYRIFARHDVEFVQAVANVVASAIVRERVESEMRRGERRFRTLVDNIRDYAVYLLDPSGVITTWNVGAERLTGWRADAAIGMSADVFYPPEELRAGRPRADRDRAAAERQATREGWRVRRDGSRFWAVSVLSAIGDDGEALAGFTEVTRDISERKRAEEAQRFLADAGAALASSLEPSRLLSRVVELAVPRVADAAGVFLRQEDGTLALAAAASIDDTELARARVLFRACPTASDPQYGPAHVVTTGESELVPEISDAVIDALDLDSGRVDYLRAIGLTSGITVPLVAGGAPFGALALVTTRSGRRYGAEDLALAEEVGRRVAVSLENARLYRSAEEARDRAEKLADELSEQRKWLEAVLDSMPTAFALVEPGSGGMIFANKAFKRLAGGPVVGPPHERWRTYQLEHADGTPLAMDELPSLRAARGEALADLEVDLRVDGRRLSLLVNSSRLPAAHGRPEMVLVAWEDVTRLKQAERDLTEAVRARDVFLSVASHELRTPLTTLRLQADGLVRLVGRGGVSLPERLVKRVQMVHRQTDRLDILVRNLLDVSRIAAGRLVLEATAMDMAAAAEEVVALFRQEVGEERIRLERRGDTMGVWDRVRVEQVVTNLVSNAVKYGQDEPVDVVVEGRAEEVAVTVTDRGIGIAPEQREHIFSRFGRVASDQHYAGLGLGLWIARQIVEAMGGRIEVQSEVGEGTTFEVALPRRPRGAE